MLNVPLHLGPDDADFSRSLAFIEGGYVPLADAKLSVRDFGFMHADATYDVMHVWKGGFFRLRDHMDRFAKSLAGMRLDPGLNREQIVEVLAELVRRAGLQNALLYWACTRGQPPFGSRDPALSVNTFFAYVMPLVLRGSPEEMRRGLSMQISRTVHRIPSDSVDPVLKNNHWGDFTRAWYLAKDEGFDTTVLTSHDGLVAEGPGFNIFALTRGELISPDSNVLEGISRQTMLELAAVLGTPARLGKLTPEALLDADEVFITSTSCGLFPVTRLDGRILGNGAPGPVTTRLLNLYYEKKDQGWHITPISGMA